MAVAIPIGNVHPVNLFGDEPIPLIFDPIGRIDHPDRDLNPFGGIARIANTQAAYVHQRDRPNRPSVIIALLLQMNPNAVDAFLGAQPPGNPPVRFYHLHFPNGQQYDDDAAWQQRHAPKLFSCYSIRDDEFLWNIRDACATACGFIISYCDRLARQNQHNGNIGVANAYVQRKHAQLHLQRDYNDQLIAHIDQQQ